MKSLIKYFETLYQLSDILYIYSSPVHKEYTALEKLNTGEETSSLSQVEKKYSLADDDKVISFFKTVLDYYYHQTDIPLNHKVSDIPDEMKAALIKKIPDYSLNYTYKASRMYDLVDFIFITLKKVLLNTKKGYNDALKVMDKNSQLDFRKEVYNISMYLYVTFIHVFPEELRVRLKKELKISDLDQKILDKCHGIIIRHNQERICNIKRSDSPTSPLKSSFLDAEQEGERFDFLMDLPGKSMEDKVDIPLKSKYSIGMLLNIFSVLQGRKRL